MPETDKTKLALLVNEMIREDKLNDARMLVYDYIISCNFHFQIKKKEIECEIRRKHYIDVNLFFNNDEIYLNEPVFLPLIWNREELKFLLLDFVIGSYYRSRKRKIIDMDAEFVLVIKNIEDSLKCGLAFNENVSEKIQEFYYKKLSRDDIELLFFLLNSFLIFYGGKKRDPFAFRSDLDRLKDVDEHKRLNYVYSDVILNLKYLMDGALAQVAREESVHWKYPRRGLPILEVDDDEYVLQELEWQKTMMLKFVFGLYEFSGGIDSPVWKE